MNAGIEFPILFDVAERQSLTKMKRTSRKIRSTRLGAVNFMVESGVDQTGKRTVPDELKQFVPKECVSISLLPYPVLAYSRSYSRSFLNF